MKAVKWVNQSNPTSAADALEKSIAKWRFFSYCTRVQLDASDPRDECGLCYWFREHQIDGSSCKACILANDPLCGIGLIETAACLNDSGATLAEFHAAARLVFKKLRSLRK